MLSKIYKTTKLFERAIELDNSDAMYQLALCYENGIGVKKNIIKAIELYYKSGENLKGDELCNSYFDIITKYEMEVKRNHTYMEDIKYLNSLDNNPSDIKDYFYDWLKLKQMNDKLKEFITG